MVSRTASTTMVIMSSTSVKPADRRKDIERAPQRDITNMRLRLLSDKHKGDERLF